MVVIGGMGDIWGVIVGAIFLSMLNRFMLPELNDVPDKLGLDFDVTSKSRPSLPGTVVERRASGTVDHRQDDRADDDAPDGAEAAEDDHAEDEDREENWNWSALTVL